MHFYVVPQTSLAPSPNDAVCAPPKSHCAVAFRVCSVHLVCLTLLVFCVCACARACVAQSSVGLTSPLMHATRTTSSQVSADMWVRGGYELCAVVLVGSGFSGHAFIGLSE